MKFLACVAEKHTKKQISPIYEVDVRRAYNCVEALEELTGIKINGVSNYVDCVEIIEETSVTNGGRK